MRFSLSRMVVMRLILACVAAALLSVPLHEGSAADDVTWSSYDVTVEIKEDGTLHVTEAVAIDFGGAFSKGHRAIPMKRIGSIENVSVEVETSSGELAPARYVERYRFTGEPGTYTTYVREGDFHIDYGFLPTGVSSDATDRREIVLAYDAVEAIRVYDDADEPYQEVRWTAISADITEIGRVERGSVTVLFPEAISPEDLRFDPKPTSIQPDRVTWERANLSSGDALQVLAAFPPITAATEPAWQEQADREAQLAGFAIVAGMAIFVAFSVFTIVAWRSTPRHAAVGLVAEYLDTPPDDLPAGLVGALVDNSFDARDAVAMLLDLDRRGVIEMDEDEKRRKKKDDPKRFGMVLRQPFDSVPAWERPLLVGLFGKRASPGKRVSFDALKKLREKHQSSVSGAIIKELHARGFYEELPQTTRSRWVLRLLGLSVVCLIPIGVMAWWASTLATPLIVLLVMEGVLFVVAMIVCMTLARRTELGAETTARWKAFGRYLDRMEEEMPIPERLALFDRYLPWAVVLGFDNSWKKWMSDTAPEVGFDDDWGQRRVFTGSSSAGSSRGGGSSAPSLQGMSGRGLSSLQAGSGSVFLMLNSAVGSFNAGSGSSSSGSSGSASSGSSGGGSHSFS